MASSVQLLGICAGYDAPVWGGFFCIPLAAVGQALLMHSFTKPSEARHAFFDSKKPGELTVIMNENIEAIEQGLSKNLWS